MLYTACRRKRRKMAKVTKELIEQLIVEELSEIDEGALERFRAKLNTAGTGLATGAANLAKKAINPLMRKAGREEFAELDPKLVKQMKTLTLRMNKAGSQVQKVYNDIYKDYVSLKGQMDDAVQQAAAETIEPKLQAARGALADLMKTSDEFKAKVGEKAKKGSAQGTELERGTLEEEEEGQE